MSKSTTVTLKDRSVVLTKRESRFLKLLMSDTDKYFHKSEIMQHVWSDVFVAAGSVRTLVYRLRYLFGKDFITKRWGKGYRIHNSADMVCHEQD